MSLIIERWHHSDGRIQFFLRGTKLTTSIKPPFPLDHHLLPSQKKSLWTIFSAGAHWGCQCQSDSYSKIYFLKSLRAVREKRWGRGGGVIHYVLGALAHWLRRKKKSASWQGDGEKVTTSCSCAERSLKSSAVRWPRRIKSSLIKCVLLKKKRLYNISDICNLRWFEWNQEWRIRWKEGFVFKTLTWSC